MQISRQQQAQLLKLARQSIKHGLIKNSAQQPVKSDYDPNLQQQAACFVTLTLNHSLRGCIGHLEAIQPLYKDVAENAFSAAFKDPRFSPLSTEEFDLISIEISVLTPAEAMSFSSEEDLLQQIQPGLDGLILEDGYQRGTFLPSVWESLPDRQQFWQHLKLKAGLAADHWSDTVHVSRYRTLAFSE